MQTTAITEQSIARMVEQFYLKVREDDLLGPVFERQLDGKWDAHMPRMVAFWTKVLLDTGTFQGNVYGKHMALAGIEPAHFRQWLALLRETVDDLFDAAAADAVMLAAGRIAGSLQLGFFGRYATAAELAPVPGIRAGP